MNLLELADKWEREADEMERTEGPAIAPGDGDVYETLRACAQELHAALPEQPLSRKWREEAEQRDAAATDDHGIGFAHGMEYCANDLDAQHDEDRALLDKAADALENHGFFEQKLAEKIRKHLGSDSDDA